ncbi:MAG TPA: pitrilysin family protein, partial [Candidatus Methylomirabilis sp.]|nr:pitrilysin family protein [Candidatus Methylomirabilis sp.]
EQFQREVLENGIVILTEHMPQVRSVSIGVWVKVGSRFEKAGRAGISHFIEHLLFKGTLSRSAEEIARAIDGVGGALDAFTSRETTCFYAKVLGEHLPLAVDLLSDLVLHPRLDPEDLEKERRVVLEEIKMVEDDPDDLIHDLFTQQFWPDHPLGRPVLGSRQTLQAITREDVLDHLRDLYQPDRVVIAAAGDLDHGKLTALVGAAFGDWRGRAVATNGSSPVSYLTVRHEDRDSAQLHLVLGAEGLPYNHPNRYAFYLLNAILGSSMSSRLFQEIREKRGLAYSIYSYQASYHDSGLMAVYAGTSAESYPQVVDLIRAEFARLRTECVDLDEFQRAKEQLKGNLLLGLESTSSRMTRLAKAEIYFQRSFDLDEIIRGIEGVKPQTFAELTQSLLTPDRYALTTIGRLN